MDDITPNEFKENQYGDSGRRGEGSAGTLAVWLSCPLRIGRLRKYRSTFCGAWPLAVRLLAKTASAFSTPRMYREAQANSVGVYDMRTSVRKF